MLAYIFSLFGQNVTKLVCALLQKAVGVLKLNQYGKYVLQTSWKHVDSSSSSKYDDWVVAVVLFCGTLFSMVVCFVFVSVYSL